MTGTILRAQHDLDALEPEWRALYQRCPQATPFQSPSWLIPWSRHFPDAGEPCVFALRRRGRLIALAPLLRAASGRATWLGVGLSDYLDVLIDPEHRAQGLDGVWRFFESTAHDGVPVELRDVAARSSLLDARAARVSSGTVGSDSVCPRVALPSSVDDYFARLPGWLRRNVKQGHARLERRGPSRWEPASARQIHEFLASLVALHTREWNERGEPGIFADPRVRAFHEDAAPRMHADGQLRLYGLRSNERLVSVVYVLGSLANCQYIGGFDPQLKRCNLGSLGIFHAITRAIAAGATEYDFLRGAEAYKYGWGASNTSTFRVLVGAPARQHVA